ncbi:AsmA family protein [Salinicola aestuarinus]|uniref:AsmA family protein n=1 Tax=Salinicola aestuarinus TaxID=1949082 RepID=UPI000DA21BC3|nr:AsmA family protein [Salinicola aestuarinus]
MTKGKKVTLWVVGVVLVLLVALVIVVATFDWNRLKPTLNEQVSQALDRPFAIEGDLDVQWALPEAAEGLARWIPQPHVRANDVRLGSPDAVTDADLATLEAIDVVLSPLPLLSQTVAIPAIALSGGEATLVRLEDGTNNWTFSGEDEAQASDTSDEGSTWTVDIGEIAFDPIDIHYRDAILAADIDATVELLGEPIAFEEVSGADGAQDAPGNDETPAADGASAERDVVDFAFAWRASGTYRDAPVEGSGRLGGLGALRQTGSPYPIQAELEAGATQVSVDGTLTDPLAPKRIDLDLSFAGQNLGELYGIIGVTLPDTPPYSTRGHLTADLASNEALTFRYRDFDGQIGNSDIHGDLTYRLGEPRPSLTGEVVSRQLRFADLAPLIGADSNADKADRGETSQQPEDKVLPTETFDTEQWRAMDADVKFTAERIEHGESLPLDDLYTHVVLDDGEILLDPLRFGVAGGNLNTTLRLDGSQNPMQSRVDMHIRHLLLSQLFPDVELMQNSRGELNGDATLSGTGNSVAAILGSSDGNLQALISDGVISQNLMELAGLNVGNYLVGELFGDEQVDIHCAATHLEVDDGLARTRFFVIDTETALINIDGTINFATEGLDLTIEPESKGARVFTLRSPLYVEGTFKNPSPGVDAGSLLARGAAGAVLGTVATPAAALLALVSPSADGTTPCNDFLSEVQTE